MIVFTSIQKKCANFKGFPENRYFLNAFYCFLLLSFIAVLLFAWKDDNLYVTISISIAISLASFISGVLMGFIFGFPHDENEEHNKTFKEVADWLSKIIIGLGLVELKKLYHIFNNDVSQLATNLNLSSGHGILFGCLIIGYSIVGFIISYYITITDILKRIVNVNKEIKSIKDKLQSVPNPKSNIVVEDPNNERLEINESLIQEIVSNSNIINLSFFTIEEIKKICYLLYNNEYYDLAVKYFQALYEKDKSDYTPLLNAGFILSKKLLRHDKSNDLYDVIIGKSPEYAGAYYNKACNYVRMNDLDNARKNIQIAFGKDRNLYEFAKKDLELNPIRDTIDEIFNKIN